MPMHVSEHMIGCCCSGKVQHAVLEPQGEAPMHAAAEGGAFLAMRLLADGEQPPSSLGGFQEKGLLHSRVAFGTRPS